MHMNHGIFITLPDRKVQMYDRDFDTYRKSFEKFRIKCEHWIGDSDIKIVIENTDGFRAWFMKNKCCSSCRIYNWDYAMMFTPLFFVRKTYTWSLLVLSVALLVRWEITFYLHPERFSEKTNDYLQCKNCTEK